MWSVRNMSRRGALALTAMALLAACSSHTEPDATGGGLARASQAPTTAPSASPSAQEDAGYPGGFDLPATFTVDDRDKATRAARAWRGGDMSIIKAGDWDEAALEAKKPAFEATAAFYAQASADDGGDVLHVDTIDDSSFVAGVSDDTVILAIWTVAWTAPPEQKSMPKVIASVQAGEPLTKCVAVTLKRGDNIWLVTDVSEPDDLD